ncbi:hypothetical protein EBU99_02555 [bacterium]|nr:hypothetical protein [bacterium]
MNKKTIRISFLESLPSKKIFAAFFIALTTLQACGTETGNPIIKRPTTPRTVAQDTVEADLIEFAESSAEFAGSTNASLAVALASVEEKNLQLAGSANTSTTCVGGGTHAEVSFQKSSTSSNAFKKASRKSEVTIDRKVSLIWDSPNGGLSCVDDNLKKSVRLLGGAIEQRKGQVSRNIVRSTTSGGRKKNEYTSASMSSEGLWTTNYNSIEISAESVLISKTLVWKVKKSNAIRTTEGESLEETASQTVDNMPIQMTLERSRDALASIKTRTIKSGTTRTTRKDQSVVETSFDNVVFSGQDSCFPSSGKLSGRVTPAPGSGQLEESFEVDFSASTNDIPEIVFADGERVELSGFCLN